MLCKKSLFIGLVLIGTPISLWL